MLCHTSTFFSIGQVNEKKINIVSDDNVIVLSRNIDGDYDEEWKDNKGKDNTCDVNNNWDDDENDVIVFNSDSNIVIE